ncbi:MAG: cytochrome c-type biogenesis protein CcmH [Aquabacterium sp.]
MADHPTRRLHGLGRLRVWLCALLLGVSASAQTWADELDERVNRLASELRCLVCQNQTIADSHAELAVQLKNEVRQQLSRGASEDQVRDFMVSRYGEFVLYRPPVNRHTWLLWGGPAVLLLLGAGLAAAYWRERQKAFTDAPDSALPGTEEP